MKYLVDTDVCIALARRHSRVLEQFKGLTIGDAGMSIVTHAELVYGAHKGNRTTEALAGIDEIIRVIGVQPLDMRASLHYGRIRSELEQRGTTIGPNDLLIAAHAVSLDVTLVTGNTKEFARVKGLRVENWIR